LSQLESGNGDTLGHAWKYRKKEPFAVFQCQKVKRNDFGDQLYPRADAGLGTRCRYIERGLSKEIVSEGII
jgi:hypothetical protein